MRFLDTSDVILLSWVLEETAQAVGIFSPIAPFCFLGLLQSPPSHPQSMLPDQPSYRSWKSNNIKRILGFVLPSTKIS